MKKILYGILSPTFGKKHFARIYEVIKNISYQGLNYRNTNIVGNGELFLLKKIKAFYKSKSSQIVLFDVGANVGNYSRNLYEIFGNSADIYAFEPFSYPYQSLVQLKEFIPSFLPFKIGLSDKEQKLQIYSNKEFSEIGGLYNRDFSRFNIFLNESEESVFDRLDNFSEIHKVSHIHLLKIDVEGHELFVLKGAERMLKNNKIDFIQFEYGTGNYLSKTYLYDFFQLLSENYRIYKLLSNGILEIKEYNTDIEIHILSNYVAVRRSLDF